MKEKQLKHLNRRELLEMLIEQEKENVRLQQELAELRSQMEDRRIIVENSGSMAEAALSLSDVFRAADQAAQQYLDSVRFSSDPNEIIAAAQAQADEIIDDAKRQREQMLKETYQYVQDVGNKMKYYFKQQSDLQSGSPDGERPRSKRRR